LSAYSLEVFYEDVYRARAALAREPCSTAGWEFRFATAPDPRANHIHADARTQARARAQQSKVAK